MQKVIGLGGPFIKARDPKGLAAWYERHLGIPFQGKTYTDWKKDESGEKKIPGSNVLSFFKMDSDYFKPSEKDVMINLIVADLDALIEQLRREGIETVGDPMDESYGKFGWILDPEGNKVELWEPKEE